MPVKKGYAGRTIVTILFGLLVVALSLGTWLLFFGSGLTSSFDRTASTQTVSVSAENLADGVTIRYSFYDRRSMFHNGKIWTSRLISVMQDAKAEKPITVWYDPNNPDNAGVEQPQFWLQWPWTIFGWGLILVWLGIYVLFLDDSWEWGVFKKKATESPRETATRMLDEIRQIGDEGKRRGALKGTWDTSNMQIRMEICYQLGADVEMARRVVGRDFTLDGSDADFGALLKALDPA